jgi:putative two-component system response regulator
MPGRDGFQILEDLAEYTRSIRTGGVPLPVIMLTGDANPATTRHALALGAKDFVAKPFDPPEVVLRIHNLLETRRLHRVLRDQNAALETTVRERTSALEDAQTEVLERLATAGEFRDDDTGQHAQRVGEIAEHLARALSIPAAQVELLRNAAPLHDVGKIGIPDRILLKPGRLTAEERPIMEAHAAIGDRMLAPLELLGSVRPIVRHHHERWDGTGYPDQLAGDGIPLLARIVAVADSIEAMSGQRPYRRPLGKDDVVHELERGCRAQWDPGLVAIALDLIAAGNLRFGGNGISLLEQR